MVEIKFKRLNSVGCLPSKGSKEAAGFDVNSAEEVCIRPGCRQAIKTGLAMSMPVGWECQVRPRSGLALKNGITIINAPGTVDSDYRGELLIALVNHSSEQFLVTKGMRIAQLVFKEAPQVKLVEVEELDPTDRGAGGFGSTGV
jgi:dUTP pyrophosphatase